MNRPALFKASALFLAFAFLVLVDVLVSTFLPYNRPSRPRSADTFVVSSPTRVHQLIPNATFTLDGVEVRTNSWGFRDDRDFGVPKPEGALRVAVLGDSFIEGLGEKQEYALPHQLERRLNQTLDKPVQVWNAGVRGGSPAVYRYWLALLAEHDLDAAVISIYDNDMDDDACALLVKAGARAEAWHSAPRWLRRSSLLSYAHGEIAALMFKARKKKVSQDIFNEDDFHRENRRKDGDVNAVGSNSHGYSDEPEKWEREWRRTEENLNQLLRLSQDKGIPLLFIHIPASVLYPDKPGQSKTVPLKRNYFGEWLSAWASRNIVPLEDLSPPINEWYKNPAHPPLYQKEHQHLNEQGLGLAAEWVEPRLAALLRGK